MRHLPASSWIQPLCPEQRLRLGRLEEADECTGRRFVLACGFYAGHEHRHHVQVTWQEAQDLDARDVAQFGHLLKDAREEAMDAGSAKDKTAVFQRYKGRINNYLSKQGIIPDKKK